MDMIIIKKEKNHYQREIRERDEWILLLEITNNSNNRGILWREIDLKQRLLYYYRIIKRLLLLLERDR